MNKLPGPAPLAEHEPVFYSSFVHAWSRVEAPAVIDSARRSDHVLPGAAPSPQVSLSSREQSVLQLSGKGYRYEEIAGLLCLSRHTVETYVKRIYRKLGVHSKTEAVFEARRLGLMLD